MGTSVGGAASAPRKIDVMRPALAGAIAPAVAAGTWGYFYGGPKFALGFGAVGALLGGVGGAVAGASTDFARRDHGRAVGALAGAGAGAGMALATGVATGLIVARGVGSNPMGGLAVMLLGGATLAGTASGAIGGTISESVGN